ncbi:MAG: hypothetical protein H6922_00595 [Pseudomonadaceae bacterium]|nr:hypothetical protein [Pseudomonadaceae bacterium]
MSLHDKVFARLTLPVKPAVVATGAKIEEIAETVEETGESFFGGYAEGGFLSDMGLEAVAESAEVSGEAKPQ